MTLIIGVKAPDGVLIAYDSLASNGYTSTPRLDHKAHKYNKHVAIGYTTSYRFGQIASWHVKPGKPEGDEYKWAIRKYIPKLRAALKHHGWTKIDSSREEGGQLLLAVRGRLFSVGSDFQVAEDECRYAAVGSGCAFALGSLNATKDGNLAPDERAWMAYCAAVRHGVGVGGTLHYLYTKAR